MGKPKKIRRLMKAAKMGKPCAMYRLGIWYEVGNKTEPDMINAAFWINKAAEAGYVPAVEWMKDYSFDDNAGIQAHS